jgi:hypothetical protein
MGLTGLRRSAAKNSGGKGKGKGGYYAVWTPPSFTKIEGKLRPDQVNTVAEPIVLIEGEYIDPDDGTPKEAYLRRVHRFVDKHNGKINYRSITCMRGPDAHNPQPCVGCYLIDHREWDEKASGARSAWVFNLAHLVPYVELPLVRDGRIQMKQGTNEPVMITKSCKMGTVADQIYWQGRGQPYCDGCSPQGCSYQRKLGGHRYWEMGNKHLTELLDFNDKVLGKICYYTGTGIVKTGFECGNCSTLMLSIATSGFTNDQLKQFEQSPQQCRQCGAVGLPIPAYDTGYDEHGMSKLAGVQLPVDAQGTPVKPRPLNIFDVVLWIQREGAGTDSKPVITKWARLTQAPFGDNGTTVDITEYVHSTVVPTPFDFEELFGMNTDSQAKAVGRPNPYGAQAQQQNFARYAQQPQQPAFPTLPPPAAPSVGVGYAPPTVAPQLPPQAGQQPMPPQPPIATPYPGTPSFPQPPQQPAQPQQPGYAAPMPPVRPDWGNKQ